MSHVAGRELGARPIGRMTPRLRGTGIDAGEPTIGVTGPGKLYYVAYAASLGGSYVLRSGDGGETWDDVSPRIADATNTQALSLDPYLHVDPRTKRIFTADLNGLCTYMSFSDDEGSSWTTNPLVCGGAINDHHTIFSGPPVTSQLVGYDALLYYCFNDTLTSRCAKSRDGGLTFVPTGEPAFPRVVPTDSDEFCGGLHGHGVVDGDGRAYLPRDYCGEPWLAMTDDEGATWTRVQIAANGVLGDPSVDVDEDGNISYAWIGRDRHPYLSVSRDGGRSWSKPLDIAPPGLVFANLLTMDAGAPGHLAFLYMGTTDGDVSKSRTWNGYMAVTTTGLGRSPRLYTAQMNAAEHPLKVGECGPGSCGDVLDFLDVVIDRTGVAWGTFSDACDEKCEEAGVDREQPFPFPDGDVDEGLVGAIDGAPPLRRRGP